MILWDILTNNTLKVKNDKATFWATIVKIWAHFISNIWSRCSQYLFFISGLCMFVVMFIAGVQLTGTGSKPSRISAEDHLVQAFRSTQKRLQQSESQESELGGGVKFLPRKSIVKSLPLRQSPLNSLQNYGETRNEIKSSEVNKSVNKTKPSVGFKENFGLQPFGFDNAEYDSHQAKNSPMLPPVYRPYPAVQRAD